MLERFRVQLDPPGYKVYDFWTGRTVVIAGVRQDGLASRDAREIAEMLNRRARNGDRMIPQ